MISEVHNNTRLTYNKIAEKYHELFKYELDEKPFDREYLDTFAGYFNDDSKIVDIGCGPTALIGRYLLNKGLNVIGLDISEKCIKIASGYNPQMKFICTDILDWNPAKNSIDGIISYYSIIYTPKSEIDKLFQVFYRSLVTGGKLLVVVKKGTFEGYQEKILGIKVHSYYSEYNEKEIEQIVFRNGFKIKKLITRSPYENEIKNERIYCLCSKI